jgi:predicted nucleotidyltransferase
VDKKSNIINIVRQYKRRVQDEFPLNVERFYLFGSFAKGCAHEGSDIDVALIVSHLNDDYSLDTDLILWRLRRNLDFRIEPHLLARDEDPSYFIREIESTGIEID